MPTTKLPPAAVGAYSPASTQSRPASADAPATRALPRRPSPLWIAIAVGAAVTILPNVVQFAREWLALRRVAHQLVDASVPRSEVPYRLQEAVRAHVRVAGPFKHYNQSARPFLRPTAWETWSHAEGLCGDGARLLVVLLRAHGIRATRVNLSNDGRPFGHTAVVYERDGVWYFLDSINTPEEFLAWSRRDRRPFSAMVEYRVFGSDGGARYYSDNPYFTRYNYLDLSRVMRGVVELNFVQPLPTPIVVLLEHPPLFRAAAATMVWAVAALGALAWSRRRSRRRVAVPTPRLERVAAVAAY